MHLILLLCVICGVLLSQVKALTQEQINQDFTNILVECLSKNPITSSDLNIMTEKQQMPNNTAAKCLFACAYKKSGMMDENGMLSPEGVQAVTLKYYADDDAKIKISDEFTNACLSVNDEPVEDGSKGCERAALMFECSVKKAPEFDFL